MLTLLNLLLRQILINKNSLLLRFPYNPVFFFVSLFVCATIMPEPTRLTPGEYYSIMLEIAARNALDSQLNPNQLYALFDLSCNISRKTDHLIQEQSKKLLFNLRLLDNQGKPSASTMCACGLISATQ